MINELEKLNSFINKFYENFGDIDPNSLTGETKKLYLKAKKAVTSAEQQRSMMDSVLDTFSDFGVNSIQIGSKTFSKTEPDTATPPIEKTKSQFDDIMNIDDEKLLK